MSSVTGHTAHSERPERSRNAKAQARHRAKRKAYIEQLEQTVTKLQTALGFSAEDVAALPPPLVKIRELEQENAKLQKENDDLHRILAESGRGLPPDLTRRPSGNTFLDSRNCSDRDYKRRKMGDEVYMSPDTSPHNNDILSRPPPLTIPQPMSHHYSNGPSHNNSTHGNSSLFSLHAPAFNMPNTPSGSSSTSSPPFSPAQMQPSNSPIHHRPQVSTHQSLSTYPSSTAHYSGSVKVEDENYPSSNHHSQPTSYLAPSYTHSSAQQDHGLDHWHTYSSERGATLHR